MSAAAASKYLTRHTITETFDTSVAGGGTSQFPFEANQPLDALSTPPMIEGAFVQQLLTAGTATVDLTALTTTRGRAVNLTGLKPRQVTVAALATNTHPVTIAVGAANGYTGLGAAFSFTLPAPAAGQVPPQFTFTDGGSAGAVAVDATHKTLGLTGTGTEGVLIAISGGV
jgi:hypothetical protein